MIKQASIKSFSRRVDKNKKSHARSPRVKFRKKFCTRGVKNGESLVLFAKLKALSVLILSYEQKTRDERGKFFFNLKGLFSGKQTNGFLLLEFTIYFFLLVFLTTLIGTVLVSAQQRVHTVTKRSNSTMTQWFGVDRLISDINQAPMFLDAWKLLDENHIVWHQKNRDIGWKCQDNTLLRIEGEFDAQERQWRHGTQSLVAQETTVQYMPIVSEAGSIKGMRIQIGLNGLQKQKCTRIVACEGSA